MHMERSKRPRIEVRENSGGGGGGGGGPPSIIAQGPRLSKSGTAPTPPPGSATEAYQLTNETQKNINCTTYTNRQDTRRIQDFWLGDINEGWGMVNYKRNNRSTHTVTCLELFRGHMTRGL